MPNRVIKESICESAGLSECSVFACDLYKRLITYADDYGRFNSDTQIMRARLFPREYEDITEEDLIEALIELVGVGKISFYTARHFNQGVNHKGVYGVFPNWGEHQRLRETKAKCPDPDDTGINDWYLRRFVPLDLKVDIVERDGFKCKICGKYLTSCRDARRFVKLGLGLFHIDHVVPLIQGGRATEENLRLTCPECNMKRKKRFTFKEILEFTIAEKRGELPQVAEDGGLNTNPNTNTNPISTSSLVPSASVIALPLNDGTEKAVTQDEIDKWQGLYPSVDVLQELRKMVGWLESHPNRKKTRRGVGAFITGWLAKEQDKGKPARTEPKQETPPSSFDTGDFFDKSLERSRKWMEQMKGENNADGTD
jgi:hypothetical protein